jgi:hypothetical protein
MSAISQIGSIPLPPAAPQRRRPAKSKSPVQQAEPEPRRMCQVVGCSSPAVPDFVVQQGGDGTKCYNHGGNNRGTPPAYAPINYSSYTPDELHRANVENVATAKGMNSQFNSFVENRMLLAFRETISRLKKQGQQLNGHSDVEAYFKSIGMTYSNVRQLFSREKKRLLESMGYEKRKKRDNPILPLTKAGRNALIEASLRANALVTALEAGHDGRTEMASFKAIMSTTKLDDMCKRISRSRTPNAPKRNLKRLLRSPGLPPSKAILCPNPIPARWRNCASKYTAWQIPRKSRNRSKST